MKFGFEFEENKTCSFLPLFKDNTTRKQLEVRFIIFFLKLRTLATYCLRT
jgi:hypothetical protein